MASITISGINNKVQDNFANAENGYTGFLEYCVTPQTQLEFIQAYLKNILFEETVSRTARRSARLAAESARQDCITNITLS